MTFNVDYEDAGTIVFEDKEPVPSYGGVIGSGSYGGSSSFSGSGSYGGSTSYGGSGGRKPGVTFPGPEGSIHVSKPSEDSGHYKGPFPGPNGSIHTSKPATEIG